MTQTPSESPGALLVRKRWTRPENVARRVKRLVGEIKSIAPALEPDQRNELHTAIDGEVAA